MAHLEYVSTKEGAIELRWKTAIRFYEEMTFLGSCYKQIISKQ